MSSNYCVYNITALNRTGTVITCKYGNVKEWWLSHPNVINPGGSISIEAGGEGSVSGTFKMTISDEVIEVDFEYSPGQLPTLAYKQLSAGPYIVVIINGPYLKDGAAFCTFEVIDPRK